MKTKNLWKNEYVQTAIMVCLVIFVVFGFWNISQLVLNTKYPALAVVSGSMCTIQGPRCDGWSHPFKHSLHVGDLIILQGVEAKSIQDTYPNSDVIVFRKPTNPDELIVHRVVTNEEKNGKIYFKTKGDGNGVNKWPNEPDSSEYDPWVISEELVVGKVILRIPWIGHVVLFMHGSFGIPLAILLIILLVIIEFIFPFFRSEKT